jgi:sugar phosphate isomerase/epimerase
MNEKISVASYSFHKLLSRGMIDIFGYLESTAHRYHVAYADIWNGFLTSYDDEYLAKVKEALDERGLVLGSLCCDGAHPWADKADDMARQNQLAANCLKAAEILGAKTVRFDVGVRDMDITEAQYDVVVKAFAAYAQRGYDHGYTVGPENHWGASRRLSVQRELITRINNPGYGMLLHLGNWYSEDESMSPDQYDRAAAPMAVHTHVDYNHSFMASELLPALRQAGYNGLWGVEHHTEGDEYAKVEVHLANVRLARC